MSQIHNQRQSRTFAAFRVVLVGEAIVFFLAAILHTGDFGVPALIPAMIVEGLCGIASVISAYAVFARTGWAQKTAAIIQIFLLLSVLLGIFALVRDPGIRDPLNVGLHVVMLALIATGLSLLAIPGTRQALQNDHTLRSDRG